MGIPQKGIVGSNPILSATLKRENRSKEPFPSHSSTSPVSRNEQDLQSWAISCPQTVRKVDPTFALGDSRRSAASRGPRVPVRLPRIMRENTLPGSRSLQGGIVVYPRPETPGSWQVMWRTEKGRRYRTFPSLAEANYFASEMQRERRTNGARVAHGLMSPEDLKAWADFREATGHAPLSDLLAAWKDRQTSLSGMPISELVVQFLAMRQAEGVTKSNHTNDVKRLGRFVSFIGRDKPGNSITPTEIRAWLDDLKKEDLGPKTINHHLRSLSMALGRGVAEGWVLKNPCSAVQGPKVEVTEVSVLSLADAIRLFKVNKGSRVAVYMALEAFGGLRFSSSFRISRDEINLEEKSIILPASKHKSGKRQILEGLPENLWAWIKAADAMGHEWKICRPVYDREKKAAFERAGLSKLCNVLRHSFCSYHVALHQDAAKTALLMQHTNQAMLYRHYKGLALRAEAEKYFKISP